MLSHNLAIWCIQLFGALHWCIGALVLLCTAIWVHFSSLVHWCIALVHFGVLLTDSALHWCILVYWWIVLVHWCILVSDWLTGQHQHCSKIPRLSQVLGRESHNWRWCLICIFSQQTILSLDISVMYCQNEKNKKDNQRRWKAFPMWAKR